MDKNLLQPRHDKFFRAQFSDREVARAFFRENLPDDIRAHIDLEGIPELSPNSYIDEDYKAFAADVVYELPLKHIDSPLFVALIEHKSRNAPAVGLQLLR